MATLWLPVTLTLLVVKMNVHHEHDSYSVHNLQPQSEHISLYNDRKALTYEVSYLGKVQICAWATILSLPL